MAGADDHRFMARAVELAHGGLYTADPNPRVGCVIVDGGGAIVGEGFHARAGEGHAEVNALHQAGSRAAGGAAYVTLEPCCHHGRTPPCVDALLEAGVQQVVYAMDDPNPQVAGEGRERLEAAGVRVQSGVMAAEAAALNPGYILRQAEQRPLVRLKLAVSLDGKTALANGASQWITGSDARADVHRWRARSSVVLTGSGTAKADDPALDARLEAQHDVAITQPACVIVDTHLGLGSDARVFGTGNSVVVAHASESGSKSQALLEAGADLCKLPSASAGVDLKALIKELARREFNEIWVEAGPILSGAFMAAGLIDELVLYQAGSVLGDKARGMFMLPELTTMDARYNFNLLDVRQVGNDLRLHYASS